MILIMIALLIFGVPMVILNLNRSEEDSIIENLTGYRVFDTFINQYLLALGEFVSLEVFIKGTQTAICYIFFVMATFITQITMFNMLIAIMGDTFEHIMENKVVHTTKSKLQLMSDLIAVIRDENLKEDQERFLFIVKPEVDEEEVNFDEWEGTIRSISKVVTKNASKLNNK